MVVVYGLRFTMFVKRFRQMQRRLELCERIHHLPSSLSNSARNSLELVIYDHWLYVTPASANNYNSL
jgi:hypothetical protein